MSAPATLLRSSSESRLLEGADGVMATAHSAASLPLKRPIKTALHQAVLDGRIHQVRLLVNKHGGNVDSRDVFGRTPLMLACLLDNEAHGHRMVRVFMAAGAYLNVKDNLNRTAFHYACMKGRQEIVRMLLREDNVEINVPDNDGNTPLMHAALSGNPHIIQLIVDVFVKFGLSVDDRNGMGYTALLLACKYGHYVSAHILLDEGKAQPTLRDNEFYFNAQEWVHRSSDLNSSFALQAAASAGILQRSRTMVSDMPRFSREHSVYSTGSGSPQCQHTSANVHPLGQSLDTALRLPAVFSHFAMEKPQESVLDGKDAKVILLKDMEEALHAPIKVAGPGTGPATAAAAVHSGQLTSSAPTRSTRSFCPSTAKLLGLQGTRRTAVLFPDMRTMFRLYSEQHGTRPKDPVSARNLLRYGTERLQRQQPPPHLAREDTLPGIKVHNATPQQLEI